MSQGTALLLNMKQLYILIVPFGRLAGNVLLMVAISYIYTD